MVSSLSASSYRLSSRRAQAVLLNVWDRCTEMSVTTDVDFPPRYTKFHSSVVPSIALVAYAEHILKALSLDRACLSIALVLMDRYWARSGFLPSKLTAHRLIATCLFVSMKLHHDRVWRTRNFASVCGVLLPELILLEVELLTTIQFVMHVSAADVERVIGMWTRTSSGDVRNLSASVSPSHEMSLSATSIAAGSGLRAIQHLRPDAAVPTPRHSPYLHESPQ